jgi:CRP/FNR family transcriptional regulator, cyclic AMP receptor protein
MNATFAELRHLPLFRPLSEAHLAEILRLFRSRTAPAGEILFREGDVPTTLMLLVDGEIELSEAREPKLLLRPPASVGELAALTGVPRNTTAVVTKPARLLEAPTDGLVELFARSSEIALVLQRALFDLVADKVRRDRARMNDMRENLVRTQKRMKELRELVLASQETALSQPIFEALDDLIEHNRRGHYRVKPTPGHAATIRLADREVPVVELSEGYLKLDAGAGLAVGSEPSGVLALPQGEIPVSGRVERVGPDGVLVKLDLLIDAYKSVLLGYITQLQLLDFLV